MKRPLLPKIIPESFVFAQHLANQANRLVKYIMCIAVWLDGLSILILILMPVQVCVYECGTESVPFSSGEWRALPSANFTSIQTGFD